METNRCVRHFEITGKLSALSLSFLHFRAHKHVCMHVCTHERKLRVRARPQTDTQYFESIILTTIFKILTKKSYTRLLGRFLGSSSLLLILAPYFYLSPLVSLPANSSFGVIQQYFILGQILWLLARNTGQSFFSLYANWIIVGTWQKMTWVLNNCFEYLSMHVRTYLMKKGLFGFFFPNRNEFRHQEQASNGFPSGDSSSTRQDFGTWVEEG